MPTLSLFKDEFFSVSKWILIILGVILIIFIVIKGFFAIKEIISPTAPPPPTVSFGKLPQIVFPEGIENKLDYKINTLSGSLPTFPDRSNVYETTTNEPDLLAIERGNQRAKALGFDKEGEAISDTVYKWSDDSKFSKTLVLNIINPELYLESNYLESPSILSGIYAPTKDQAKSSAINFLTRADSLPSDIDEEKTKTIAYNIQDGKLIPATSLSNTKVMSVFLIQRDRDKLPIVYPDNSSTMRFVVASTNGGVEVVSANATYQEISDKRATYPIKTAVEAFEDLKNQKAYVATYEGLGQEVDVNKVYLAYYLGSSKQDYMTPVIVFEGSDNFVAYLPAIRDEWIDN